MITLHPLPIKVFAFASITLSATVILAADPEVDGGNVTIFVAPSGDDARDGRSEVEAVRSLARATALAQEKGALLLKRGGRWSETLRPAVDHLTIGAWGEGPLPIVTGADVVEDFAPASSGQEGCWSAPLAVHPVQVFLNGQRGQRVASLTEVASFGHWYWDGASKILTLNAGSEPPSSVEASVRDTGVDLEGRTGIQLRHLRVERPGRDGILARTMDRSTVEECEIADCYIAGIQLGGKELRRDVVVRRNQITNAGGVGIGFGGRLHHWVIENNQVTACGVLTQHVVGYGDGRERSLEWTAGIKIWGWGADGWVGHYVIRNNIVSGCKPVVWAPKPAQTHGHGIWADEVIRPTARPEIHGNQVSDCFANGVYLEKTDDHDAFDNLVYDCGQIRYTAAIQAQSNPFGYDVQKDQPDNNAPRRVSGNRIFHNTAVGGWWSFSVSASSPNCSISNTEVRDNLFVGRKGRPGALYLHGGGANDGVHGSGNRYVRNSFGEEGKGASWVWGKVLFRDYLSLEKASGDAISQSVKGAPKFRDESTGDFELLPDSPGFRSAKDGRMLGRRSTLPNRDDDKR